MSKKNFESDVLNSLSSIVDFLSLPDNKEIEATTKTCLRDYILDHYKPYFVAKAKKPSSIRGELSRLMIITNNPLTEKAIEDINIYDIELFLISIEKLGRSKATINRYRARLHAILNHAINNDIIVKNVVRKVKRYKEHSRDIVLSSVEINKLLEASKNSANTHLYLIILTALYTGMRLGEILNLKRANILSHSILLFDNETKSGYRRFIPLNIVLEEQLRKHISNMNKNSNQLFNFKSIRRSFKTTIKKAGLREFRFHDLRRTFATHLSDKDVNIYNIKEILGHSSISMTEKYIAQEFKKMESAVKKVSYCL